MAVERLKIAENAIGNRKDLILIDFVLLLITVVYKDVISINKSIKREYLFCKINLI